MAFLVLGSIMAVDRVGYAQVAPPTIVKAFVAATIPLNVGTELAFSLGNPNPGVSLTGVAFTDNLPLGLVLLGGVSNTCGGTATAVFGSSTLSFSGVTLAPGSHCDTLAFVIGTT